MMSEFNETSVARSLHDAPVMHRDCRIDQIAAQRSQPSKRAIFVCAGKPAISDDVRREYRREFPGLGHDLLATSRNATVSFRQRIKRRISRLNAKFWDLIHGVLRRSANVFVLCRFLDVAPGKVQEGG